MFILESSSFLGVEKGKNELFRVLVPLWRILFVRFHEHEEWVSTEAKK